jgi:outer membrane receptor protein involved in Fe transport
MSLRRQVAAVVLGILMALPAVPAWAQQTVRIVGTVRDETNAIALPGTPVEVVGTTHVVYTDVDGRYILNVPPGSYQVKVALDGYQEKLVNLATGAERTVTLDIGIVMSRFAETVNVTGQSVDAETSSAAAQLVERRNADVITDNMGSDEMRANGDSDAAVALSRVTGMSVVDNQYVFVRGLGERYSNTTLAGAVLPTTEPDKKVVPLDLFPSGLIDSVQVAKSYSPDKSAEFAGGLVQIIPLKHPAQPVVDLSYGVTGYTTSTGKSIPLSPLNGRDVWGFDDGLRALPPSIPNNKIVRRGVFTPSVGYGPDEITSFGRALDSSVWTPQLADGAPGQNWNMSAGNRTGKVGYIASFSHSYKEQYVEEQRKFFRVAEGSGVTAELDPISDYDMQYGTQRAQIGVVGNVAYQFTPNHRVGVENFYTHSGRDEGRYFEGDNFENVFRYRNYRVQYIEEGMMSNGVTGEHFFQGLANSRVDWRTNYARANRDEPDLRETLYQGPIGNPNGTFVLADESQSGFRMFNTLDDKTIDTGLNWALISNTGGRPTQIKLGFNYVERDRDFLSRRFRYIPIILTKDGPALTDLSARPETLYATNNIGTAFRFNEETRPTDAYDGHQTTAAGYGMLDIAFSGRTRMIVGARVESFDQEVTTFDPFGLFQATTTAENKNTDIFPAINFVRALGGNSNLRLSYGSTVNRPEFRELAEFEFTDVVGNRATKGNPELNRALIQNLDARWERFTGSRGVLAASAFYKYFDEPIERVILAAANPIATFQNAEKAQNVGIELEAGQEIGRHFFLNANYTFVDSRITLQEDQRTTQTSQERPLAGQSKNLFNFTFEGTAGGFTGRLLFNYFGDRIADVGANTAPDITEQGRGSLDLVFGQRIRGLNVRVTLENLTDSEYLYTQGTEDQRSYKLGRTIGLSLSYNIF